MKRNAERVLLTNDDGARSPLLHAFAAELAGSDWCSQLRVVVPKDEQSWIAQAVTRFRPLTVSRELIGEQPGHVVDGTPADCASLGITELFQDRPTILISGVNFGTNEGLAFYLNSGTVGGARQGMVFGTRSIALSLKMPQDLFHKWRKFDLDAISLLVEDWKRVSAISCQIIASLLDDECWKGVDLYSINLPWEVRADTPIQVTQLGRVTYPSIFHSFENGVFRHRLDALERTPNNHFGVPGLMEDIDALEQGFISLTPIAYNLFPTNAELKKTLEAKLKQT